VRNHIFDALIVLGAWIQGDGRSQQTNQVMLYVCSRAGRGNKMLNRIIMKCCTSVDVSVLIADANFCYCCFRYFRNSGGQIFHFTALHGMQSRSCDEISVCLSVCPSVKRVHCDKTEESYVKIFISYERTFILVF